MKLFTKIFLQVICVVLLLSSGIFFYTTYRWKNQSIQNINSYENSRFQTNISKFENMLMRIKSKIQDTDDKIREKMIIYAFRQVFHDSAVLYQDGKEQYNGTKYEFDLQNIRNLRSMRIIWNLQGSQTMSGQMKRLSSHRKKK